MESKAIPDQSITASSFSPPFDARPADWFAPYKGRLRGPTPAWCAHKDQTNTNQWLQIDLGMEMKVTGVASQGQYVRGVKTYYIKYSLDNSTWSTYQESSSNKVTTYTTSWNCKYLKCKLDRGVKSHTVNHNIHVFFCK